MSKKTIAILTSGGDSPGMNAAVWAAVKAAYSRGMTILGIRQGYRGLIDDDMAELTPANVFDVHNRGGTMLKTARDLRMLKEPGRRKALEVAKKRGLSGVIVMGGDGSYQGAAVLAQRELPTIGLPGTIDNDLAYTEFTLGYDTACNTACQAALNVRDTMESHGRIGIVEVMGRHCGDIALNVAMATGADYVLVPEAKYPDGDPFDIVNLADRLCNLYESGQRSFLVILAEGIGLKARLTARTMRDRLEKELSRRRMKKIGEVRETVLGYQQRGGRPTVLDINLAVRMADRAVALLADGVGNRAVGIRKNEIFDMNILEALKQPRVFNKDLYEAVQRLAGV
jgi:6-phosphofructokinase 1